MAVCVPVKRTFIHKRSCYFNKYSRLEGNNGEITKIDINNRVFSHL